MNFAVTDERIERFKRTSEHRKVRETILGGLRRAMPWLSVPDTYAEDADALDALIASLTARAATQNRTLRPTPEQHDLARREGWIHLPDGFPEAS